MSRFAGPHEREKPVDYLAVCLSSQEWMPELLMDTPSFGLLDYAMPGSLSWEEVIGSPRMELRLSETASPPLDAETLRRCAWEISEQHPPSLRSGGKSRRLRRRHSHTKASPIGAFASNGWRRQPEARRRLAQLPTGLASL